MGVDDRLFLLLSSPLLLCPVPLFVLLVVACSIPAVPMQFYLNDRVTTILNEEFPPAWQDYLLTKCQKVAHLGRLEEVTALPLICKGDRVVSPFPAKAS